MIGKLCAGLLGIINIVTASLPLLLLITLLGGVSVKQVFSALAIILLTAVLCATLGTLVGFWREKTFQSLAITFLSIAAWCVLGEAIAYGVWTAVDPKWAQVVSPFRAIWQVCQPMESSQWKAYPGGVALPYSIFSLLLSAILSCVAIARLRVWNPSRQVQPQTPESDESPSAHRSVPLMAE